MITAPTVVALLSMAAPSAGARTFAVREPVLLVVRGPDGLVPAIGDSKFYAGIGAALRARTGLVLESPDEARISLHTLSECGTSLSCLVKAAERIPYLILIEVHDERAPTATLIDVKAALDELGESGPLADDTIRTKATTSQLDELAKKVIVEDFRDALTSAGHWEPFGVLEIRTEVSGLKIEIDGTPAGVTEAPITRIHDVPAGRISVVLRDPSGIHEPFTTEEEIDRVHDTIIILGLERLQPLDALNGRSITFWSGIAVTIVGVALTIHALTADNPNFVLCLESRLECAARNGGYLRYGAPTEMVGPEQSLNGTGLARLPFGLSITNSGMATAGSTLILDDDWALPLAPLIGVAMGLATYGFFLVMEEPFAGLPTR